MYIRGRNKYHAKKTVIGDITFDSQVEAMYYMALKGAGEEVEVHPSFEIIPKQVVNGKTYRQAVYTPDFAITEPEERVRVIDVKGGNMITPDAKLRMKLFMQRYGVPVMIARYDYRTKHFEEKQL